MATKHSGSPPNSLSQPPPKKARLYHAYHVVFQRVNYVRRFAESKLVSTHETMRDAREAGIKYLEENGGAGWVENAGHEVSLFAAGQDGYHLFVLIQVDMVPGPPLAEDKVYVIMRRDAAAREEESEEEPLGNVSVCGVFAMREAANRRARAVLREVCGEHKKLGINGNIECEYWETMMEGGMYAGNACLGGRELENVDVSVECHEMNW